eukprot:TRINITY_DN63414_c0_g1_i1.p1 TRINITY_DN63414_c0_g1~~TRINITY_DN63414_c0_g1_i1.p1  ORF type:complete len:172 (-),score=24.60 TRINITY_DN63414_c0_g1_i1:123-638(-)
MAGAMFKVLMIALLSQGSIEFRIREESESELEATEHADGEAVLEGASDAMSDALGHAGEGMELEDAGEGMDETRQNASEKNGWWSPPRRRAPAPKPPVGRGQYCNFRRGPKCQHGLECDIHVDGQVMTGGGGHCKGAEGYPCTSATHCKHGLHCGHVDMNHHNLKGRCTRR